MDYVFTLKNKILKHVINFRHLNLSKLLYIFYKIKFTSYVNYCLKSEWSNINCFIQSKKFWYVKKWDS